MILEFKRLDPSPWRKLIGKIIINLLTLIIGIIAYQGFLNYSIDEVYQAQFFICALAFIGGIYFNIRMYILGKKRTILYLTYDTKETEIMICTTKGVLVKSKLKDIKYFHNNIGEIYDIKVGGKTYLGVGFLSNYQELRTIILDNCKGIYL